jgi:hypothetical protein
MRRHYRPLFLQPVPAWSEAEPVETIVDEENGSVKHKRREAGY